MSSSSPSLARAPHHDGSVTYLGPVPTRPGGSVRLRVHVPAPGASRVRVRWGQDGEPRLRDLTPTPAFDGQWWTGELPLVNARTSYRFLIEGPDGARHRWLTAEGVSEREVSYRSDFVLDASDAAPDWVA
ncbi:MAG: glycoside hydrolase family 13 protein, partial [Salana multivorans]|nr:glycoside hydrolase family 13 protein [Salana multivorans]